jgi:hypothetical protein
MNKPHKPLFLLSVASFFFLSSLSAVQTDPVGYTTLTGDTGGYVVTLPLAKSAVFEGTVNAVGTTVLNFDSTVPTLAGANYVQVMDGVLVGAVVDIVSSDTSSVTLSSSLSVASGVAISIRPHTTIEDLGTNFTSGTSVTVYNSDGTTNTATYINNFLGSFWDGDYTEAVYPGEGVVIISTGPFEIINAGAVAVDPVSFSAAAGRVNIIGANSPSAADADAIFGSLAPGTSVSVYTNGGSLTSPTTYSRSPEFLGGTWSPDLATLTTLGDDIAVVVIPAEDAAVNLPATAVN